MWVPSGVAAGWAPYTYGHWVWISPWGWTWVDDEPWGFAPFHYGRWVYGGGFWGWAPGPYYARPFYAPALVAWFGGPRFGVGFGFGFGGGIGWCPLGWGEPFFPWYRGSWGYFNRVNIYNTRIGNINQFHGFYHGGVFSGASFHYANLRAPGGAIAVPQRTLTSSLSVRGTAVRVPASEFSRASLGGGRVPVAPTRDSRLGANASRASAAAPSRSFSRPVASAGARGGASANLSTRSSEGSFGGNASASGHYVPRPPQGGNGGVMTAHNNTSGVPGGRSYSSSSSLGGTSHYVPRPPAGARIGPDSRTSQPRTSPGGSSGGGYARPSEHSAPRSSQDSGHGRSWNSVPRPTGAARADSSTYASNAYSGRYSSPQSYAGSRGSYGAYSRSYGESSRFSAPSARYGSTPSYRGYSAPQRSYSASSRGYSAPSYHSSGSYSGSHGGGGGGHYSGGGGGGHSSGGGGHSGHR